MDIIKIIQEAKENAYHNYQHGHLPKYYYKIPEKYRGYADNLSFRSYVKGRRFAYDVLTKLLIKLKKAQKSTTPKKAGHNTRFKKERVNNEK